MSVMLEIEEKRPEPSFYLFTLFLNPMVHFGLLQSRKVDLDKSRYGVTEIRKTPLFNNFISFRMNSEC
jgi:hypothetical protein